MSQPTSRPQIPPIGTTVILRQNKNGYPFQWNFNNRKPEYIDAIVVILRETASEVVVQLKTQPIEAYIPRRFFLSKGSDLAATPPIISIPESFEMQTLPL
jgi:hypothetical protein